MNIYFVGDIQGCYQELRALLTQVNFNPKVDQLWPAGDLVARGPDSYQTLEYLISLGDQVKPVLGNHDLHLLAIYYGIKKAKPSDKLDQLLDSAKCQQMISWLSKQPLMRKLPNEQLFMSHAGISPQWTIQEAIAANNFVQQRLNSAQLPNWLNKMYGQKPNDWQQVNTEEEYFRYAINAFTRMRYCHLDGSLDFDCKLPPEQAPASLTPWFTQAEPQLSQCQWVFGHWAALMGQSSVNNIYPLDTGCVWGEHLTLLLWSDRKLFTQAALIPW